MPSLASRTPSQTQVINTTAGEAIAAGDICYIAADGRALRSNGTTLGAAAARVRGICFVAAPLGEAVSLYHDVAVRYGTGLTPGANLFASAAVPGGLSDTATAGGTGAIGFVESATVVRILYSTY